MGITGLLPALKPLIKSSNIQKFHHQRVAVDTYSWIHKALYGYLDDLIVNENSLRWVTYCLKYLDMLLAHDMEVYLVFDGANLPAKSKTEQSRAISRTKNSELGLQYLQQGDKANGRALLARSVDVTPRMAAQLIRICKECRPTVKCVVAPYEADAQLAYLSHHNLVDVIITEDSDCIPYLCKEIIFKLDNKTGDCEHFSSDELTRTMIDGFDLMSFTPEMITQMCILSGCDYLSSPVGYGMKKSHKLVSRQKTPHRLLRSLKFEGSIPLTNLSLIPIVTITNTEPIRLLAYEYGFYSALMTFLHQTVFDICTRQHCSLTPIPDNPTSFPAYMLTHLPVDDLAEGCPLYFLGNIISDSSLACAIADGLVDPVSKTPFNLPSHMDPVLTKSHSQSNSKSKTSIQSKSIPSSSPSLSPSLSPSTTSSSSTSSTPPNNLIPAPTTTTPSSHPFPPNSIKKDKNLKDFFTPLSKSEHDKLKKFTTPTSSSTPGMAPGLQRSKTCPNISSKKDNSIISLDPISTPSSSTSSSSFNSRDKQKLNFMESFVQSKKQRKSYPILSTKESLQLLSDRTRAIARKNLLALDDEEDEDADDENLVNSGKTNTRRSTFSNQNQFEVIVLSDSDNETEIPDDKLSLSLTPPPESYLISLSPPLTPSGEEIYSGLSTTPLSPCSMPSFELSFSYPSINLSQSSNGNISPIPTTLTGTSLESEVIDDSDPNTTPIRPLNPATATPSTSAYSSLRRNNQEIHSNSLEQTVKKFSSRKKNRSLMNSSSPSSGPGPTSPTSLSSSLSSSTLPSPVGVTSFSKYQYICN